MSLTYIIITLALICGSWIGSDFNTKHQLSLLPPKIQNITQIQNTQNDNTSIQSSSQAQITTTVITGKTNFNMAINYNGRTNISHNFSSRSNRYSKTNK